jgi:Zn-dependent metalloprotease
VSNCVVPPHLLRRIEQHGTEAERARAAATLRLDQATRTGRAETAGVRPVATRGPAPPGRATADLAGPDRVAPDRVAPDRVAERRIFDGDSGTRLPGRLVRAEGDPAGADVAVNEAYDGLGATLALYRDLYRRNSLDGAGLDLVGTVHYGDRYDNAQWNGTQMVFGDGDGTIFNRFTSCIDVIGHELTHGLTQYTANLRYRDQPGALNESLSDVFGALVKQYNLGQTAAEADWLIGEGIFAAGIKGVAIRSMKAPGTAYDDPKLGRDPQPSSMAGYLETDEDNGGVHVNSGIPNHAFYLAATALGGYAWERAGQVWFDTLTDPELSPGATFARFARLTVHHAARFGAEVAAVVGQAWHEVGVDAGARSDDVRV